MTRSVVLLVIALAQAAFFGLLVLLLVISRLRRAHQVRRAAAASRQLAEPLQRWGLGTGSVAEVVETLRGLPTHEAFEQITRAVPPRLAGEQLARLASTIREEQWVARTLARASSRFWWRRLDAARLLGVVAGARDRALVVRLLSDPHPAVQAAASVSLARVGDAALVAHVLETLHTRSIVVRVCQLGILRQTWPHTVPALLDRLRPGAPVAKLELWIPLAGSLRDARCLASLIALRHHPVAQVRISTARALRDYLHADAAVALREMIVDDDWRVRAQAARALGAVGAGGAVPDLTQALQDPFWWVRFRAALALAQLGEPGRRVLRDARALPDRYAADMAIMVSGLPDGTVVELAEA